MSKKKISKLLSKIIPIIILLFILVIPIENNVYATNDTDFSFGSILSSVKEFLSKGKENSNSQEIQSTFIEKTAPLFSALLYIGFAVAVGTLIILGVQFAMANPEKKADLKARLIGFVVATVILGAAIPIWTLVVNTFSSITDIKV